MNFLVRYKKQYLDHVDTSTGEWDKDDQHLVHASFEYYDEDWHPTGFGFAQGEFAPIQQKLGMLTMFPRQWAEFSSILEVGSEARGDEIRWVEEEDE